MYITTLPFTDIIDLKPLSYKAAGCDGQVGINIFMRKKCKNDETKFFKKPEICFDFIVMLAKLSASVVNADNLAEVNQSIDLTKSYIPVPIPKKNTEALQKN